MSEPQQESALRSVGDTVWVPRADYSAIEETCPDCLGSAKWKCSLPNGEEFEIECPRCYPGGFSPSIGVIRERYETRWFAVETVIYRIEVREDRGVEYGTHAGCFSADDVFDTEADALKRSEVMAREHVERTDAEMRKRGKAKGRQQRRRNHHGEPHVDGDNPAWKAHYARSQVRAAVKEAQRWIEHAARHGTVIEWPEVKP